MGLRARELGQGIDVDAPMPKDLQRLAEIDPDEAVRLWLEEQGALDQE
jgi:hypothetical protein